jgi:hypothetical protein
MAKNACLNENQSNDSPLPNDFKKLPKQQMKQNWKFTWDKQRQRKGTQSIQPFRQNLGF